MTIFGSFQPEDFSADDETETPETPEPRTVTAALQARNASRDPLSRLLWELRTLRQSQELLLETAIE